MSSLSISSRPSSVDPAMLNRMQVIQNKVRTCQYHVTHSLDTASLQSEVAICKRAIADLQIDMTNVRDEMTELDFGILDRDFKCLENRFKCAVIRQTRVLPAFSSSTTPPTTEAVERARAAMEEFERIRTDALKSALERMSAMLKEEAALEKAARKEDAALEKAARREDAALDKAERQGLARVVGAGLAKVGAGLAKVGAGLGRVDEALARAQEAIARPAPIASSSSSSSHFYSERNAQALTRQFLALKAATAERSGYSVALTGASPPALRINITPHGTPGKSIGLDMSTVKTCDCCRSCFEHTFKQEPADSLARQLSSRLRPHSAFAVWSRSGNLLLVPDTFDPAVKATDHRHLFQLSEPQLTKVFSAVLETLDFLRSSVPTYQPNIEWHVGTDGAQSVALLHTRIQGLPSSIRR